MPLLVLTHVSIFCPSGTMDWRWSQEKSGLYPVLHSLHRTVILLLRRSCTYMRAFRPKDYFSLRLVQWCNILKRYTKYINIRSPVSLALLSDKNILNHPFVPNRSLVSVLHADSIADTYIYTVTDEDFYLTCEKMGTCSSSKAK